MHLSDPLIFRGIHTEFSQSFYEERIDYPSHFVNNLGLNYLFWKVLKLLMTFFIQNPLIKIFGDIIIFIRDENLKKSLIKDITLV